MEDSIFFPLPMELVLHVVTSCLRDANVILDQSHIITRTLLSFTLVCHETNRLADRYLRQHCVCLNSEDRLQSFLSAASDRGGLRNVTCMTLAPFDEDDIDNLPHCQRVRDLLIMSAPSLTKLVIDIPLHSLYPDDDIQGVRSVLREGFESLVNLEEFVSVQDDLYLDVVEAEGAVIWSYWPKLKLLSLFGVSVDEDLWRHVARLSRLETLILSYPDLHYRQDPKAQYGRLTDRPLQVVFCLSWDDTHPEYRFILSDSSNLEWEKTNLGKSMTLLVHRYIIHERSWGRGLQLAHKAAAEDNSLWEWQGQEIPKSA